MTFDIKLPVWAQYGLLVVGLGLFWWLIQSWTGPWSALGWIGGLILSVGGLWWIVERVRSWVERRARAKVADIAEEQAAELVNDPNLDTEAAVRQMTAALVPRLEAEAGGALPISRAAVVQIARLTLFNKLIGEKELDPESIRIVETYLQALPRNVKRFLNRFWIAVGIAFRRGLFSGELRVSRAQLAKWLVLCERWPLLIKPLTADPQEMVLLENRAKAPYTPAATQPAEAALPEKTNRKGKKKSRRRKPPVKLPDPFMERMKVLAPLYEDDDDLRDFCKDKPLIGELLDRLVHFESSPADPTTPHEPQLQRVS